MAKKKKYKSSVCEPNLTPMIDCTFQLIIFFILTAQMAQQDRPKIEVHKPWKSIAVKEKKEEWPNRLVITVISEADASKVRDPKDYDACRAKGYQVGIEANKLVVPGAEDDLKRRVEKHKAVILEKYDEFVVEIRADQDLLYSEVEPVLRACADAGSVKMHITAAIHLN